jgi:hypothetical protein
MSMLYGLGQGLQQSGDSLSKLILLRDQQKRENEAIQRALDQQEEENTFRHRQLGVNEQQARTQNDLAQSTIRQNLYENAKNTAINFPNAPVPPAQAQEWLKDDRAALLQQGNTPTASVSGVNPITNRPETTKIGAPGDPGYMTRMPETERVRIEGMRAVNRASTENLKAQLFREKLAQDKDLAEMANQLGQDRIAAIKRNVDSMLGFQYDNMDYRGQLQNAEMANELMIAEIRAEAAKSRQNLFLGSIPGLNLQGQPGGGGAPAPTQNRQPVQVGPATRRDGAGAPPPQGGGNAIADAIKKAAEEKARRGGGGQQQ